MSHDISPAVPALYGIAGGLLSWVAKRLFSRVERFFAAIPHIKWQVRHIAEHLEDRDGYYIPPMDDDEQDHNS